MKMGSYVSHFNVSLIVLAKSQDSVHKPQFLKREESRSALPLGQTGSRFPNSSQWFMYYRVFFSGLSATQSPESPYFTPNPRPTSTPTPPLQNPTPRFNFLLSYFSARVPLPCALVLYSPGLAYFVSIRAIARLRIITQDEEVVSGVSTEIQPAIVCNSAKTRASAGGHFF